jgi:hypothetical protein
MAGYQEQIEPGGDRSPGRFSRRRLLVGLGAAAAMGVGGTAWALTRPAGDGLEPSLEAAGAEGPHSLDDFAANIESGGPGPDGIPSIDQPDFVAADQVEFLRDDDVVFGQVVDGQPRAYPQLVLVWHEIVNEVTADGPLSVTYCPLTGTAIGFRPHAGIEQFGTTGSLVNSNLLMYDRMHDSQWPQILGQAINGPRRGDELAEFGLEWTTWRRWREAFPGAQVLSAETGFVRRYGEDPYGSYNPIDGYYAEGRPHMFPIMVRDKRFDRKTVFIGAKLGEDRLAVHKQHVIEQQVVTAELAGAPVVFLHDPQLATVRGFRGELAGEPLALEPAGSPGEYADAGSGAVWDSWGAPVSGTGEPLTRIVSYDVMWFAWAAFFHNTAVIA